MDSLSVYRITLLGAVIVIVLGTIAAILTLPSEPSAEQYRIGLLSAIAVPTLTALLTLLRADTVNNKVDRVRNEVDGHLQAHSDILDSALQTVKEVKIQAIQAGVDPAALPPDPNVPPSGV